MCFIIGFCVFSTLFGVFLKRGGYRMFLWCFGRVSVFQGVFWNILGCFWGVF